MLGTPSSDALVTLPELVTRHSNEGPAVCCNGEQTVAARAQLCAASSTQRPSRAHRHAGRLYADGASGTITGYLHKIWMKCLETIYKGYCK